MITRHGLIVLIASVSIAATIPFLYTWKPTKKIDYKTFHTTNGWGYDILINKKLVIHQQYIPAIPEKKGFDTEEFAKRAAGSVVDKLKNNKLPTLSYAEINQICKPIH
jgi:serine protease inhibitor ecotin